jgi:hypothetical protein
MNNGMFEKHLMPGEKILWYGQPGAKKIFHPGDIIAIPFAAIFCAFAFFWEYTAFNMYLVSHRPGILLFTAFGAIFLLAGLYHLAGRFFFATYAANRTWYALTGGRAIIITKLLLVKVKSIELKKTAVIRKNINKDGTGTISFGNDEFHSGTQVNSYYDPVAGFNRVYYNNFSFTKRAPAFVEIENAGRVYDMICDITGITKKG